MTRSLAIIIMLLIIGALIYTRTARPNRSSPRLSSGPTYHALLRAT